MRARASGPPPPKRTRPCAICWVDPETKRTGTNATTWICLVCRKDPANKLWSVTPRRERHATQFNESFHASVGLDVERKPEPYSNAMCIEIVRLWLLKRSQTDIAEEVGCSQPYVFKVVAYWRRARLNTLNALTP